MMSKISSLNVTFKFHGLYLSSNHVRLRGAMWHGYFYYEAVLMLNMPTPVSIFS